MPQQKIERVVVVGAGGVGAWLTVALRRDRPHVPVIVYDDDTFEGGMGARRLPLVRNAATKKVDWLRGFVRMVMGDEPPDVEGRRLVPEDTRGAGIVRPGVLVVDCTDMAIAPRRELWDCCRTAGAQMLRVSYDGNGCVVVARGLPLLCAPEGGYALVPTLGQSMMAGGLGAEAVRAILDGRWKEDYQIRLPKAGQED